jgi:pyruvate,orthophosphate dikinase
MRPLLASQVQRLERDSGLAFGSSRKPLLVSVRSGAAVSMPGMMETLLNVGLTESSLRGLLRMTGNPRLVWDSYRRLVQSFAEVVHRCPRAPFETALATELQAAGVSRPQELDYRSLETLARRYLAVFESLSGHEFPQDPMDQLESAVRAVFESWNAEKAKVYRRMNRIDENTGTAVTIQRMVFGNAGGTSGSGVAFTRDPATGEDQLYMDFMFNAQGEDVVSGRRAFGEPVALEDALPDAFRALHDARHVLEAEFRDAQEIEFTVENGKLYFLQTRSAKRTPWAALRIAVEQANQGLIDRRTALAHLSAYDLAAIQEVRLEAVDGARLLCRAEPASIGVASGAIALDAQAASRFAGAGRDVILVREETSTDDIAGIATAGGILTALGGRTSHAVVVARQLAKVCIVGCRELVIDFPARRCAIAGEWFNEGDVICLDGRSGQVFAGEPLRVVERPTAYLAEVEKWRREAAPAAKM